MSNLAYDIPHYSYEDYLSWEDSWELIDGVAYAMSPAPYPRHQKIVAKIWKELDGNLTSCSECEIYISPVDWKIDEHSVVQPDVALFCEEPTVQYFSKTPPLVVEVLSKATALKDVTVKFELYQKQGVQYYVIVEPQSEVADIFKLIDGKYQLVKKFTKIDSFEFELESGCKTKIDFANVFK
jgi:Uma2 family endonuclease